MKPKGVIRKRTTYILNCSTCGKEVEVNKDEKEVICYDCRTEAARAKALHDAQFLIGAELIEINPKAKGHLTDYYELSSLKVKTKEGKIIEFTATGFDEIYIEWEEVAEKG